MQEGLDILLDVAAHIKKLGRNDVHFTCVGGGPGLDSFAQDDCRKGCSRHCELHGQDP